MKFILYKCLLTSLTEEKKARIKQSYCRGCWQGHMLFSHSKLSLIWTIHQEHYSSANKPALAGSCSINQRSDATDQPWLPSLAHEVWISILVTGTQTTDSFHLNSIFSRTVIRSWRWSLHICGKPVSPGTPKHLLATGVLKFFVKLVAWQRCGWLMTDHNLSKPHRVLKSRYFMQIWMTCYGRILSPGN